MVAVVDGSETTAPNTSMAGTLGYAAPEVLLKTVKFIYYSPLSPRSLPSLGVSNSIRSRFSLGLGRRAGKRSAQVPVLPRLRHLERGGVGAGPHQIERRRRKLAKMTKTQEKKTRFCAVTQAVSLPQASPQGTHLLAGLQEG